MGISRRKPLSLRDTLKKPSFPKLSQNADAGLDESDWRTQLGRGARQRIVNRILVTLKRHLPFSGEERLREVMKIAARFEAKNYTIATIGLSAENISEDASIGFAVSKCNALVLCHGDRFLVQHKISASTSKVTTVSSWKSLLGVTKLRNNRYIL